MESKKAMESKRRHREAFANSIANSTKNNILKQQGFEDITLDAIQRSFLKNKKLMPAKKNELITNEDSQNVK